MADSDWFPGGHHRGRLSGTPGRLRRVLVKPPLEPLAPGECPMRRNSVSKSLLLVIATVPVVLAGPIVPGRRAAQNEPQAPAEPTPSALERDSQGWVDPLADAGADLEGLDPRADPAGWHARPDVPLVARPGERPAGLRRRRGGPRMAPLGPRAGRRDPPRRVAVRAGRGREPAVQLGRLRPQLGRRHDLAPGPDRRRPGRVPLRRHAGGRRRSSGSTCRSSSPTSRVKPAGEWNTYEITCQRRRR